MCVVHLKKIANKCCKALFFFTFSLILFSCGKSNSSFQKESFGQAMITMDGEYYDDYNYDESEAKMAYEESTNLENLEVSASKLLIKHADISFKSNDIKSSNALIHQLLNLNHGYIVDESIYQNANNQYSSVSMVIKVPSTSFDKFIDELSNQVDFFEHKHIYTEDVTTQVIDTQARLNVKKDTESKYLQLLEKAKTVSEVLEIERELQSVRYSIESLEGQLKSLSNQIAYSTINLNYYTNSPHTQNFFSKILEAFKEGALGFYDFFIGLISIWPFILILICVIIITIKIVKVRRKKSSHNKGD